MRVNPLTATDSYKLGHRPMYPDGTTLIYSNLTPRSTKYSAKAEGVDDKVVFFGLQYFMQWFLVETFDQEFFKQKKNRVVKEYKRRVDNMLGKDSLSVDHIEALHDLGYLPISIRALAEGSVVNEKIPVLTIENTHPDFFWLTNYLESVISCMLWKPCTSATTARKYRQLLEKYAKQTGADPNFIQFQAHDFSFRGMGSYQDAVLSGAGHLTSFSGTDTVAAIDFVEDYYYADSDKELIGVSVPASEHSVTSIGMQENEYETFRRLITWVFPKGILSLVSDTWDFWAVVTDFMVRLKPDIMARDGKVVIRPDSGDPVDIICGTQFFPAYTSLQDAIEAHEWKDSDNPYEEKVKVGDKYHLLEFSSDGQLDFVADYTPTPEEKGAVQCLWDIFGGTETDKGYKVLDSHIGLIYGDSITLERADQIMRRLKRKGFASSNVVLGIGSYTYNYVTRDTLGFAIKATAGVVDGETREISKNPKTDSGMKKSAKGYLKVIKDDSGEFALEQCVSREEMKGGELKEVFRDGDILIETTLKDVREQINQSLAKG